MTFTGATFETELAVRPDDLDLFQHVHSTRYLDYVLAARFDQMKRCYGMAMEEFLKQGLGWVVRRSFVEYKRPLKMGDTMIVRTRVEEFFKDGVKVWFEILRLPDRSKRETNPLLTKGSASRSGGVDVRGAGALTSMTRVSGRPVCSAPVLWPRRRV